VREDREQGGNDRGKGGNRIDRSNNDRGNVRVEKRGQGGNDRGNDDRGGEVSLYVGNIPWDLSWQDLKDAFEEYNCAFSDVGEIRDGRGRGYGIVKIPNMSTAKRAIKEMDQVSPLLSLSLSLSPTLTYPVRSKWLPSLHLPLCTPPPPKGRKRALVAGVVAPLLFLFFPISPPPLARALSLLLP
jgi:RNA recognition motif-containing protein